jgi:hypothetical protein
MRIATFLSLPAPLPGGLLGVLLNSFGPFRSFGSEERLRQADLFVSAVQS